MPTARTLIADAYVSAGMKGFGEAVTAAEYQHALRVLQRMQQGMATQSQLSSQITDISATVGPGTFFTIATGGDFNVSAPSDIEYAYARVGGTDYMLEMLSTDQYMGLADKITSSSIPEAIYFDASNATPRIAFYPPLSGATEVHIGILAQLIFPDLDTNISMSLGDEEAIMLSLAEKLCIGVKRIDDDLRRAAFGARNNMKAKNIRIGELDMGGGMDFDITSGRYR